MRFGVVVQSEAANIWEGVRQFRMAIQRTLGVNDYQFRQVREGQFIFTLRPLIRSAERLGQMAKTIASLVRQYLGIATVRHHLLSTQAEVEAILG